MNIAFNSQTSYSSVLLNQNAGSKDMQTGFLKNTKGNLFSMLQNTQGQNDQYERSAVSDQMHRMLRELKQSPKEKQNPYAVTTKDKENGFLEISGSPDSDEEEKLEINVNYNYKEVATKIRSAKTSVSAGQALICAKRKVQEIKRKISSSNGDPEELQLALTHAKRMEMVARKKKHHLELEEMVQNTQKRDENKDRLEEAASDTKNAIIQAEEEKVTEKEDAIFDKRREILQSALEENKESNKKMSDEMIADLNRMISKFGEEELKQLEEAMEMLENMEIIDPHMSKEDFEDLKRKHRAAENKAIAKADMDYLKDLIKHQVEKGGNIPGMGQGTSAMSAATGVAAVAAVGVVSAAPIAIDVSASMSAPEAASGLVDIQV